MIGEQQMQKTLHLLPLVVVCPPKRLCAIPLFLIFGAILKKCGWYLAHGGGQFPSPSGASNMGSIVRPDLVADRQCDRKSSRLHRPVLDRQHLYTMPEPYSILLNVMGEDKICLGSDYPFREQHPGKLIEEIGVYRPAEKKKLAGNAQDWLNLRS